MAKTTQVQLRLTEEQRDGLKKAAADAGFKSVTEYILDRTLPKPNEAKRAGKLVPYTRIGKEEIAVKDLLTTPVFMKTEEKK